MNDLITWVTEKWLSEAPTRSQGSLIWYYVARFEPLEELHVMLRFYEFISPIEHPKLSKKKADVEFRVRAGKLNEQYSYQLFEKEENGLKPIRSFTTSTDLIIYLDTVER